jgi:HD-GYP domain-containing protein (c-di-GMP phosphodiesterase class II)
MRRIAVRELIPGMVLAKAVHSDRGDLLLNAEVMLTDRYVALLRDRGFAWVFIQDPDTNDVEIEEIVSERVRLKVTADLARLYDAVEGVATGDAPTGGELQANIEDVVDEVLGADVLTGINTIRSFDSYQFVHALDSTVAAVMIARRLHFPDAELHRIASGCLLHDIGMVAVERAIQMKPGKLSPAELDQVRMHPQLGYEILRKLRPGEVVANHAAFQHHERQDGTGYPRGLHGNNRVRRPSGPLPGRIVLNAEIVAVADVYDALGVERPYRPAMAPDVVVRTLRRAAGGQLNREIVGHLLEVLPVYPLGADVVVLKGAHKGYRGIVSRVHRERLDRPTVRLLWDRHGTRVPAFEVDLRTDEQVITCLPVGAGPTESSAV